VHSTLLLHLLWAASDYTLLIGTTHFWSDQASLDLLPPPSIFVHCMSSPSSASLPPYCFEAVFIECSWANRDVSTSDGELSLHYRTTIAQWKKANWCKPTPLPPALFPPSTPRAPLPMDFKEDIPEKVVGAVLKMPPAAPSAAPVSGTEVKHPHSALAGSPPPPTSDVTLSMVDVMKIFCHHWFINRDHLIVNVLSAQTREDSAFTWVDFSPEFHSHLLRSTLHLMPMGPTQPGICLIKTCVFMFLLEVLSGGPCKGFFDLPKPGHKAGKKGKSENANENDLAPAPMAMVKGTMLKATKLP
jgi:hypothetical protein